MHRHRACQAAGTAERDPAAVPAEAPVTWRTAQAAASLPGPAPGSPCRRSCDIPTASEEPGAPVGGARSSGGNRACDPARRTTAVPLRARAPAKSRALKAEPAGRLRAAGDRAVSQARALPARTLFGPGFLELPGRARTSLARIKGYSRTESGAGSGNGARTAPEDAVPGQRPRGARSVGRGGPGACQRPGRPATRRLPAAATDRSIADGDRAFGRSRSGVRGGGSPPARPARARRCHRAGR